jgi:aspartyl-tRNA(Asn)/glutamyl-tRNA(Gln) amidotransferase subunit A
VVPCTAYVAPIVENWDHFATPSFTSLWSLLGYPALGLPCGFDGDGMPIGMQMIAHPFEEKRLLGAAADYQRRTDWHARTPVVQMEETA